LFCSSFLFGIFPLIHLF
jgi:predicted membrane chloride channel (bestrophin family)